MSERADRAKQFMPFAALKGYYEMVKAQEKIIAPRRELSEYKASLLSEKLLKVRKGIVIKVVYYKQDGYIKTDRYMATSLPGVYAAGDIRDTVLRQVVTAAADGAIAATAAIAYLQEME